MTNLTKETAVFPCELVEREYRLTGLSRTAAFPSGFPDAAIQVQRELWARKEEVAQQVNEGVLVSPFMCNGIYAAYLACLETAEGAPVPAGMIDLFLPQATYALVRCTNKTIGQGYDRLHGWIRENEYKRLWYGASQIEVYYIDDEAEEEPVELLIPVQAPRAAEE
ncbi:hypothetical protein J31TS4_23930 [Paenibacillus sp. J31TS4]|uniref:GyrI-like domain-containing protein n=1 Tax=Paenibacillus sp. J31TS4 TaxID=2807195 RepID=UPI001B2A4B2E|nr:GyrI-like domain-containing protein [Paenibacillus sp. J31TS4]GIP39113.1 hypothetical protein J31TS4_23930 [Paenibacillus sp. J31TS4]